MLKIRIYFIRHGETKANLDPTQPAILTRKGKKQIERVVDYLKDVNFDAIYTSDLERAKKTAKFLGKPIITDELREIFRIIIGGPQKPSRPNREVEDRDRAEKFFEKMKKWDYKNVAVVAHGNIIRYFLARFQDKELTTMWDEQILPASITIIDGKTVSYVIGHLQGIETKKETCVE